MKRKNKYIYYKVFQGNYGYGWEDLMFCETYSDYTYKDRAEYKQFKENIKLYHENERGVFFRIIHRKELNN